ncbi:MAG: M23 family metallopeptidase [Acidimicrobiales bacterium]
MIGASVSTSGVWLLTVPIDVPLPGYTSSATAIDGASIAEQLAFAQACDQVGELPDFVKPVAGPLSSRFGIRTHPIWGIPILHAGADIAAAGGTPIVAAADGTVVAVDSRSAYGNTVVLDHGGRVATIYAHLSSVAVEVGQQLSSGEQLGSVGSTGFVTGAHLHLELRVDGEPIDPAPHMGL